MTNITKVDDDIIDVLKREGTKKLFIGLGAGVGTATLISILIKIVVKVNQ